MKIIVGNSELRRSTRGILILEGECMPILGEAFARMEVADHILTDVANATSCPAAADLAAKARQALAGEAR